MLYLIKSIHEINNLFPGGFRNFIERSNNLCNGYKATFLIAVKRTVDSKTAKYSKFLKDVKTGMKKWFNVTVYTGLIPGTNYSKELSTVNHKDLILMFSSPILHGRFDGRWIQRGEIKATFLNKKQKVLHRWSFIWYVVSEKYKKLLIVSI